MRRPPALLAAAFALAAPGPAPVQAQAAVRVPTAASAASPDGTVVVSVAIDGDGRATYAVTRRGRPVIAPSGLGFLLTDAPKIERDLELVSADTARRDTSWTQPFGEWKTIRDRHNELAVRLRERKGLRREIVITFRVFDDGVGFRYSVPDQPNLHHADIAEELTQFALAEDGTAWWKPAFERNREEYLYGRTALSAVGTAQTVFTARLASGTHVAIHEAALVDYSAMNLAGVAGTTTLKAVLTPGSGGAKVSRDAPFATPWRTIVIADNAPGLYMSHIELNLNEPNRLGDVSWLRPGKFVGVWWNMIKGDWTWATGPRHGATTANVKRYIDFAAANGIPGVLVEGWNVGWDGDWMGDGTAMRFDTPTPDFDAAELQRYAAARKVHLIGHHETGGSVSHYDAQLDRAFAYARDRGIPAVKTGYVTDAGQIERVDADGTKRREWHEGQWMVNHHARVVATAARYRVGIDSHEPVKDTGLRRTWPNWLSREGGRGMEYNAWPAKNPPEHEANMFFTQWLGGPMDFTPGILSLTGVGGSPILSTLAKQLALYVVIYSPVQMAADTPENYAKHMDAFRFIRDVPVDWADTRVLNGEVGDYATVARKDRASDDWYLGSITDEKARTLTVKLDFLDRGRTYTAQVYRDGAGADYRTDARRAFAVETRTVHAGDAMTLALAPGGGQAIRFVAGGRGRR